MARWLNKSIDNKIATCSSCRITQTVNMYDEQIKYRYCPYCGARMEGIDIDTFEPMTADEFHIKRVVPARQEVRLLESEWNRRNRAEKAAKAGVDKCTCDNCAYSCTLLIDDHNHCLGGKCTCCNDYCHRWMPETPVSAWLRQNAPYNEYLIYRLKQVFGEDFLECGDTELVKQGLEWMNTVENKTKETKS